MTAPDLTSYHAVHTALRDGARRFADAVEHVPAADRRRRRALARYWKGFAGELHAHHTIEDDFFFPALAARVDHADALLRRSDADHERLTQLMDRCTSGVATFATGGAGAHAMLSDAARELTECMDTHLDFEDVEMLPLFSEHFTDTEYADLEEKAFESLGAGPQAAFTVPFVLAAVDASTRAHLMESAPRVFAIIYRLFRGRYARLEQLALGATPTERLARVG